MTKQRNHSAKGALHLCARNRATLSTQPRRSRRITSVHIQHRWSPQHSRRGSCLSRDRERVPLHCEDLARVHSCTLSNTGSYIGCTPQGVLASGSFDTFSRACFQDATKELSKSATETIKFTNTSSKVIFGSEAGYGTNSSDIIAFHDDKLERLQQELDKQAHLLSLVGSMDEDRERLIKNKQRPILQRALLTPQQAQHIPRHAQHIRTQAKHVRQRALFTHTQRDEISSNSSQKKYR